MGSISGSSNRISKRAKPGAMDGEKNRDRWTTKDREERPESRKDGRGRNIVNSTTSTEGLSWVTKGFERGGTELDSGRNARGTRKPLCVSHTIIICEIVVKL